MNWCERSGVHYVIGLARNARLEEQVQYAQLMLADEYERTGCKQRWVSQFDCAARSWTHERRIITRLEWGEQGGNPRFVVTNLEHAPEHVYDQIYCQRGEAENRIKEAQVGLFATRTSCRYFASNQLRVLLAGFAYVLMERLRALACAARLPRTDRYAAHQGAQACGRRHSQHASHPAELGLQLAERTAVRERHGDAALTVNSIQRLAAR